MANQPDEAVAEPLNGAVGACGALSGACPGAVAGASPSCALGVDVTSEVMGASIAVEEAGIRPAELVPPCALLRLPESLEGWDAPPGVCSRGVAEKLNVVGAGST